MFIKVLTRLIHRNSYVSILYGAIFLHIFLFSLPATAQQTTGNQSYNYSKVSEHPRLLLKKGEELQVQSSIYKNTELKKVDGYIHQVSDVF
ncbi:hypothetical protein [Niabella hibiscisoli]|uniref:hypothetical protein n=1 Tax=Niabella hibiscisoli TaxID=1825928 RepID=UPI001F0CDE77|nr:hypothetical protein [Niabella hibiscisoli]MCH5719675.1 hypothetical protein [Niabella hibiscisoli]